MSGLPTPPTPHQAVPPAAADSTSELQETVAQLNTLITGLTQLSPEAIAGMKAKQAVAPPSGMTQSQWDQTKAGVSGAAKAWKIAQAVGVLLGLVFSAGVAWAVFMGENATDSEVDKALVKHNGGVDPTELDSKTGLPQGAHPELRKAIGVNAEAIRLNGKGVEEIKKQGSKLDKRSRYQFLFSRWQAKLSECRRTKKCGRHEMVKPPELDRLEQELMND